MSSFFPIDLIKEVKIRPGIYNREELIPPRKEHKQQLWMEIAEKLTPPETWQSCTQEEKQNIVCEISNKWKNLKGHFYREVKLLESGEGNKKRKYIYFNAMQFVRPYIGLKVAATANENQKMSIESNNIHESQADESYIDMEDFLKTNKKALEKENNIPVWREKTKMISYKIKEKSNNAKDPMFNIRENDLSFCLSLVPTLRKMSDDLKLGAKINILQILQKNIAQTKCNEKAANNQHVDSDELEEECEEAVVEGDPLKDGGSNKSCW